jgi:hypothetical protein
MISSFIAFLLHYRSRRVLDYGAKMRETPILISFDWYVWKINEPFINVGKLEGKDRDACIGLVINPYGLVELLNGNKYPITYPAYG